MNPARVTITVDEEHLPTIGVVADDLREHGMEVEQVLAGLGVVTGLAPDPAVLQEVVGVQSVDAELTVQLPSPEDGLQ